MATKTVWYKIYDFKQHGQEPQLINTVRSVEVNRKRICLAYNAQGYYAMDDRCPHAGARFGAGGWCDDDNLVCPVHRNKYNLLTGRGLQGDFVQTYPTEKRADGLYVGFQKSTTWWWPF